MIKPFMLFVLKQLSFYKLVSLLLLVWLPMSANAYTGVTVVMNNASTINVEFVEAFKAALAQDKTHTLKVKVINLSEVDKLSVAENSELVVALGVKSLEASSKLRHTTPVLGVFTPLPAFNKLLYKSGRRLGIFSAIVLDQPYRRQIGLAKAVLPNIKSLGILLGATSGRYEDFLRQGAQKHGYTVSIEHVYDDADLIPKLEKVFESNGALLAIPDPIVYNRQTAQSILLTSYRHQIPVFGYSKSYVKAGALAAVFSDAKHLARQAAEVAIETQKEQALLPPPLVPKYFSVIVNRQVEKSLNLDLPEEQDIYQKLLTLEASQ